MQKAPTSQAIHLTKKHVTFFYVTCIICEII